MKVKQTPMKAVYVEPVCDVCPYGTYTHNGKFSDTTPMQVQHVCTHCGDKKDLPRDYPRVMYVSTGDPTTVLDMDLK